MEKNKHTQMAEYYPNPEDVDDLVSKELMRLTLNDRNSIQEEIHGVNCLALEETPEFIQGSLRKLAFELDEGLPSSETKGYKMSQKFQSTYVNSIDFRLRFLRCELFDPKKAAKRMTFFLEIVLDLFGTYALERSIRLSDFNKEELKFMRKGRFQWLPFRDRSGRRIAVIFPGQDLQTNPSRIKAKVCLYMTWTAGNCIDTQRKGVVVLVWTDKSFEFQLKPVQNKPKLHQVSTVRICAIHFCTPDTSIYRLRRAVMIMRAPYLQVKMKVHIGNALELSYILQSYGIPTDMIPITYSGTVKIQAMRQWMRLRTFLEEPIYQDTEEIRSTIECPFPNDIVFRQGTSIPAHSGNITFRNLIASKFVEIESSIGNRNKNISILESESAKHSGSKKPKNSKGNNKIGTRIFVKEVLEEMQRTERRVLNWDDKQVCWKILTDETQIYLKVEYLVREHRNVVKAQENRQWNHSSTSIFYNSGPKNGNASCGGCGGGDEKKIP